LLRHAIPPLISVDLIVDDFQMILRVAPSSLLPELLRNFPMARVDSDSFIANSEAVSVVLLPRVASLSRALPSQAVSDYFHAVIAELAKLPSSIVGTEVERMVCQRIGQTMVRQALMECDAAMVNPLHLPYLAEHRARLAGAVR